MSLQVYRKKRDFGVTPEPRGRTARSQGGRYVIQKHAARRLHYDLRLELDGVMKSWAVTRGPSLAPGEKRLAIHVEDHPIEYNTFEGTIPDGQYGGGTVMIWDRGRWYPEGDPRKNYRKGRLTFVLDGEKLKGRWHLVRMRKRPGDKQDPWLLIKSDDEAARSVRDEDVLEQTPLSVVSGRSLEEIAEGRGGKRVWQSNRSGGPGKVAKMSARKIGQPARRNASAAKPHGAKRAPRAAAALAGKKSIKRRKSAKAKPAGAPLVIEANFRDWTADRLVRQAAFKGLREDKPAQEVARETSAMAARTSIAKKTSKHAAPARRGAPTSGAGAGTGNGHPGADEVRLTHPDRVYWVDVGVTKQDLADYYGAVWDRMAPHVIGRPLALVRCPEGTKGQCFFQKHASAGLSEKTLRTVIDGKGRQVIGIDDLDGLLSLVQVGVLEIHVRGSRLDRLEVCDRIVLDLDPGEGVDWSDMAAAARDVRERLAALELEGFVKLSGGKGLHVVLPVEGTDWDSAKSFAQAIALAMAADDPDRYVAKISKSLRKGKIFVDYLRNSLEQTSVAAYSSRARSGAPVSVPVAWQELGRTTSAHQYTVLDVMRRLSGLKQDPWQDIGRIRQKLPDTKPARG